MKVFFKYAFVVMLGLAAWSCRPIMHPNLNSSDPQARINAVVRAGETRDIKTVPLLVDLLDDDDGAVRFFAVLALEKLTGTRRGYDYAAPSWRRAVAVRRWRDWLREEATAGAAEGRSAESEVRSQPGG